jgi:hypothetical protein
MAKGIPPTVGNFLRVLKSKLIQFDQKLEKRQPNIYRIHHYLGAVDKVEGHILKASGESDVMTQEIAETFVVGLNSAFTDDFPPAKQVVKQLNAYLETGKNPSLVG